ncbi:MAG: LPS assembly lipoprotein LptE [Planctomycetota bacterium]|nr:LPS assembly lipoprotein LptE [Planctomycetota bacterium]
MINASSHPVTCMRQSPRGRALVTGVAFGVAALLASCASDPKEGYSFASAHDSSIRTIAVPMFENHTFHPELAPLVTEAVAKEIQRTTPWAVTSSSVADTTLTAVISQAEIRKLANDPQSGYAQETAVTVTIDFDWVDNRTGATLARRRGFSATDTFVPNRGTGERLEVGQRASAQRLARSVVAALRTADW